MKILPRARAVVLAVTTLVATAGDGSRLTIGDPAPGLHVLQWIKGEPVPELKKGRIYVLEIWHTNCGGCIEAMPHFSELARKYRGQVIFIGLHSEAVIGSAKATDEYIGTIRKFVDKKGDQLDYTVAIDDPEMSPFTRDWFEPAGLRGIPATFIVDRQGIIAAINPRNVDEVLAQVVDGSIDLALSKEQHEARFAARTQRDNEFNAVIGPIMAAFDRKDYVATVAQANKAIANKSSIWGSGSNVPIKFKLKALLHVREEEGLAYARGLLVNEWYLRTRNSKSYGGFSAWVEVGDAVVAEDGLSEDAYQFALECLKIAVVKHPDGIAGWKGLARAYGRLGDCAEAFEAMRRAMAAAEKDGGSGEVVGRSIKDELDRMNR